MDSETVKSYFQNPRVVADYARAAEDVGLWESERILIEKYIRKDARVLELGCGAGRVANAMAGMGYGGVVATDFSPEMVEAAEKIALSKGLSLEFKVCDATRICFESSAFEAVVFAFNGLMQIPRRARRLKALREIYRVLKPGGVFIFTTHERDVPEHAQYWRAEQKQWASGSQNPLLDEYGDIFYAGDHGNIFIHSPSEAEVSAALEKVGFSEQFKAGRSQIARESNKVLEFSDNCIFRVVKKF